MLWMWELDHKEGWAPKNWCFWTVVLEETPDSPLDSKEIKPVNPKGNQSWIFTEELMLKLQYFGHLMWRADSLEKTLMLGKIECRRIGGTTEDEMVEWHHRLYGHDFEQTLGDSEGQGSLACCSPWARKESDITELLNNNTGCRTFLFCRTVLWTVGCLVHPLVLPCPVNASITFPL